MAKHSAFRLLQGEPVAVGLARVVEDQLAEARRALRDPATDPDEAVHTARKALKRARSLLRLVRDPLGPGFRAHNVPWRDLGRRLAPQRETAVALATLERLAARTETPPASLEAARRRLAAGRRAIEDRRADVATELASARFDPTGLDIGDWELLARGVRRAYARGRAAMRQAANEPSAASFHAWRKRVKDLWHQTDFLASTCPELLGPAERSLHNLSEILGEAHDLDELERALELGGSGRAIGRFPAALRDLIEEARAELRASALGLGARVYAEKPKAFVRRMEGYWRAWREETPLPAPSEQAARPAGASAA